MKTGILLLLFIFCQAVLGQSQNTVVQAPCAIDGTLLNYNIQPNNILQFFSPSFPKNLVTNDTVSACQARFYTIIENQQIWMGLYNGFTNAIIAYDDNNNQMGLDYFDSNENVAVLASQTQSLTFKLDTMSSSDWSAFQGVVTVYDPTTVQCPFSGNSINFTNFENTLIIPIASNFGTQQDDTRCEWTFTTSPGQYLKVVIKKLVINEYVYLYIRKNGTIIKRFEDNISDTKVYYFPSDSDTFTIHYRDENDASVGTYFSALISDVMYPFSTTTEQCNSTIDGNNIKVSNLDYDFGYPENQKCDYSIAINDNQEIAVSVNVFHIEKNVDNLFLTYGSEKYALNTDNLYSLQLTPAANNSLISFDADSSVQQAGFEVILKILDCQCPTSDIVFPCLSSTNFGPLVNDISYCDGMQCNYTISTNSSCSDNGYKFALLPNVREDMDYFNIYINDELHETLTQVTDYVRYFTSDTNVTVEFISGISNKAIKTFNHNFWTITLTSQELPQISPVMLTESLPTYAVALSDLYQYTLITVCSPENDTLELFVAAENYQLQNYILYDGNNFENFVGKLDSPLIFKNSTNFGQIISTSGCFTIQKTVETFSTGEFFFRMKNAQSQNCENSNNIMLLSDEYVNFGNTAKSTGNCEITILSTLDAPFPFHIRDMDGTPNNIFTLKSTLTQNIFAQINSTEFSNWQHLSLYTPALSVSIPPSTTFNMNSTEGDRFIYAAMNQQKGIMASPSFGDSMNPGYYQPLYTILPSDSSNYITAEFILRSITGNETVLFQSDFYGNYTFYLRNPGDKLVLNGTQILLLDKEYFESHSFLIEYVLNINSLHPSTSTTLAPSTSTPTTSTISTSTTPTPTTSTPTTISSTTKTAPSTSTSTSPITNSVTSTPSTTTTTTTPSTSTMTPAKTTPKRNSAVSNLFPKLSAVINTLFALICLRLLP